MAKRDRALDMALADQRGRQLKDLARTTPRPTRAESYAIEQSRDRHWIERDSRN